jgi:uncharacterized protein YciI
MTRFVTRLFFGAVLALPLAAQPTDLYQLVLLRPSPDRKPLPKEEGAKIQSAHMAHIKFMADSGALVAAGPFGDTPTTISGVFIFKAPKEEVLRLANADPTVTAGRNLVEMYAWRGPKGIGEEYARLIKADPKLPDNMGVHPFLMFRRGPAWARVAEFVPAHLEHIKRLRAEGKLAAAGPIEGDQDLAAVFVFQRIPDAEARSLADQDPFVKSGVVVIEPHRWWCGAHVLPGW